MKVVYKMLMAAILEQFSIFEIFSKIERYYNRCIENIVLCDKNAKYWKRWKVRIIFQFLEKILQEFYKNPTFVTFCDNVFNDDVILLMSKYVFIIKEQ